MGRMLETLKMGDARRALLTVSKPADEAPVQDCVTDWEIAEEVPYVEVGGPQKRVELSPGLMKHAAQAASQPPHLAVEAAPAAPKPMAVTLSEVPATTVAFEPWHDAAPPAAISPEIVAYHQRDHAASLEYQAILEALRGPLNGDAPQVLLMLGSKLQAGTSTVVLNLATIAAMRHGLRVVVIDGNMQRPGLGQRLGHLGTAGLADVIEGTLAMEQAIVKTEIPSLHLLPAGETVHAPTGEVMTWLLSWLKKRYDLIFIDGPALDEADAAPIAHADAAYVVVPQADSAAIGKAAAQKISGLRGRLCGLIHTHFEGA